MVAFEEIEFHDSEIVSMELSDGHIIADIRNVKIEGKRYKWRDDTFDFADLDIHFLNVRDIRIDGQIYNKNSLMQGEDGSILRLNQANGMISIAADWSITDDGKYDEEFHVHKFLCDGVRFQLKPAQNPYEGYDEEESDAS